MAKKEKFVLIDGNALIHRAFHALPPLTTKKGEMVSAVYGFLTTLFKVLKEIKPTYIAVAFDRSEPTFRHKEYKEYKATREKAPDELYRQIPRVKQAVDALNIPWFDKIGFEADDIVGTLAEQIKKNNPDITTFIVTGDLDEIQLVDENINVYTMRRGFTDTTIYNLQKVKEKYGLSPQQFIDFKALRGDPSDNIPGVSGIGEKTATNLIQKYEGLEEIYQAIENDKAEDISDKIRNLLIKNKKIAFLSKKLSTIVKDVPVNLDIKKCCIKDYNREKAVSLFQELEFKSLLKQLPKVLESKGGKNVVKKAIVKKDEFQHKTIKTKKEFKDLLKKLKKQKGFVVDTETDSLNNIDPHLVGISFCWNEKLAYYVPCDQTKELKIDLTTFKKNNKKSELNSNYVLDKLRPVLEDKKIEKWGHNLKYDINVFANYDIELNPAVFDTMIAAYILNPGDRRFKLDDLAFSEFGYEMIPIEDLIGKGKEQFSLSEVSQDRIACYSCEDAIFTFKLMKKFLPLIKKEGFLGLFYKIEMPLIPVLAWMERNGVKIDKIFLNKLSQKMEKQIEKIQEKIYKQIGYEFNINSPQQLKKVLFEDLKIDTTDIKKTKTGYSTAASELKKLKDKHKIIDCISQYRELVKLKTTYIDTLPRLVNFKTGRVHTNFNQTITATGRLSSSGPNLQNIPIRTEAGRQIRGAFITERGYKLVSADYSQIELRIIAHLSGDKKMTEAFKKGEDIHTRTAAEVNDIDVKDVTYKQRRAAKAINFGIIYGMSAYGLSQSIGTTRKEAQAYIDKYYSIHSGIKKYVEEIVEVARQIGYVETIFGRRRYLPEINYSNHIIKAQAERMAINFPAQGAAADMMKIAMINITNKLSQISCDTKMLLQVHDELVFEVPEKDLKKISSFLEKEMESVSKLSVPIQVDISYGKNWKDLKAIIRGDKRRAKDFSH